MRTAALKKYLDIISADYADTDIRGAAIDSRHVKPGMIFFACRGNKSNGNKFAQSALENGASVVVMDDVDLYESVSGNKVLVRDTVGSIYGMGKARLSDIKAIKIAITGSFGKTSTKEMLKLALEGKYSVQASDGNHNNLLGVSLTACGINDDTGAAIFEMGTNAVGEINVLGKLVRPDIAVLTGYGYAHVGNFMGLSQVIYEKLSLVDSLAGMRIVAANVSFRKGLELKEQKEPVNLVYFGENTDIFLKNYEVRGSVLYFTVSAYGEDYQGKLNYPYPHLAENLLSAFAVGLKLGVQGGEIAHAAGKYVVPEGRGTVINVAGLTIIDDAYNASLESVLKAIEALVLMPGAPKYALIGEIKEIEGHERYIYNKIVEKAKETHDVNFILSGSLYQIYKSEENITVVAGDSSTTAELDKISSGVVLIKASHSCNFDKYVEYMKAKFGDNDAL